MDPPVKFAASPGTPLFPLSPERVNGSRAPYGNSVSHSPTIPEFGKTSQLGATVDPFVLSRSPKQSSRHSRNNSDALVQSMVARFDTLSVKDYRASNEVAMKRAEMAREMAELETNKLKDDIADKDKDVKKLKEESRRLKRELEEVRERERKVVKRIEVLMV